MTTEKNQKITLVQFLKVKGKLASIVEVESLDAREPGFIRSVYVVRGDAQGMGRKSIDKNKIAYISYSGTKGGNGFINYIFTDPDFEGMHIGRSLLGLVLREMKRYKMKKVDLVLTETNEKAKRFFESVGFKRIPSRKDGAAYLMTIPLDRAEVHSLCVKSWWPGKPANL